MRKINAKAYDGNHNKIESLLAPINHELVSKNIHNVPSWIETYHLTSLTFIWVIVVIIGALLSRFSTLAVWVCLMALVGHIITDALDGALGRLRNTGLVKWGYYVDHFGDYLLSCALIISFRLIEPELNEYLIMFLVVVITGFFIHSLLSTVTLNKFTLTFFKLFSPLEGQLAYVFVYLSVIMWGSGVLLIIAPIIGLVATLGLGYLVVITANKLWRLEISRIKNRRNRVG